MRVSGDNDFTGIEEQDTGRNSIAQIHKVCQQLVQ